MDKARRGERTGVSESIEVRVNAFYQESQARGVREAAFPAGIERVGRQRDGRSPKGEQAGASESIEVRVNAFHQESQARNLREAALSKSSEECCGETDWGRSVHAALEMLYGCSEAQPISSNATPYSPLPAQ
jgi:hypothetical protein